MKHCRSGKEAGGNGKAPGVLIAENIHLRQLAAIL
jgi:hypothetical protein